MAPRGRTTKSRTSRMDAAIDAMAPFGFTKEVVIAKMRQLLKEYGGQDGYGFIELDAYCVLLEALLADQDKQNQEQGETSNPNEIVEAEKAGFIDIPICPSTPLTVLPPPSLRPLVASLTPLPPVVETVLTLPPLPHVMDAILPPPPPLPPVVETVLKLPPVPPAMDDMLPSPPENGQPRRRKPCHGWISDVDEEWHFITLPSSFNRSISPPVTPPTTHPGQSELTSGRKFRPKRQSRWDLMPEDM
ncbi:hypothetical protein Lser_V15G08916 [Lactuca serriola]